MKLKLINNLLGMVLWQTLKDGSCTCVLEFPIFCLPRLVGGLGGRDVFPDLSSFSLFSFAATLAATT